MITDLEGAFPQSSWLQHRPQQLQIIKVIQQLQQTCEQSPAGLYTGSIRTACCEREFPGRDQHPAAGHCRIQSRASFLIVVVVS